MFSWASFTDFSNQAQQSLRDLGDKISEQASAGLENVRESAQEVASESMSAVSSFVSEAQTTLQQTNTTQQIEQMKRQKLERQIEQGCCPWEYQVDSAEEYDEQIGQELEKRIRQLSEDENNFLMAAPTSSSVFEFDMDSALPYALCTLQLDSKLNALRFKLVPSRILEDQFWKNYFYRVQVLRESMGVPRLNLGKEEIVVITQEIQPDSAVELKDIQANNHVESKVDSNGEVSDVDSNVRQVSTDDERGEAKSVQSNESGPSVTSWVDVPDNVLEEGDDEFLASDDVNIENLSPEQRAKMQAELGLGGGDDVDLEELDAVLGDVDDVPDITDAELERELSGALP